MHTLATLVRKTARRLEAAGVGDARLEADLDAVPRPFRERARILRVSKGRIALESTFA